MWGLPVAGFNSSSAGGWQPGRQHRGVVGLGALLETPDTGPACRHHNTHVEWKDRRSQIRRISGSHAIRAIVSPARDNGCVVARPETGSIPDAPGSYQFLDAEGRVIYVGKAKSLRSRLSNYFLQPELLAERTRQMVTTAESVEWIVAKNEVEAFFLEFNLIKRHKPRFNIRLKDDKSYPYLAVTLDEDWPRAMVLRGQQAQGRPLLRSVRARLRDPRDARPAAAHVPDPHVHEDEVRPAPPARPPVPLRAHREVRGAVRRRHRPRRLRQARPGAARLPRRRARRDHPAARSADARGGRPARVRARGPGARPARERAQGDRTPADGRLPRGRLRPHRSRRRPPRSERAGVLRAQGAVVGRKGLVVDKVEDVETPGARRPHRRAALRRRAEGRRPQERSSCRSSPKTSSSTKSSSR